MRIGLIGHNSVEYIQRLLQIWNNNDSAVLLDPDMPFSVVSSILNESNVEKLLIEDTLLTRSENLSSFEIIPYQIKHQMPCTLPESVRELYEPRYDESEVVVIYSSGTTGRCKGVSLSHRAISNNADSIIDYMDPSDRDVLYLNKKLTHSSTLVGELLAALKSGSDILLSLLAVPPRVAFRNITDHNVSILCCNPSLLKMYSDEAERTGSFPESVRTVYTSGDMISAKEIEKARTVFKCPVFNVYGQTECGPRITAQTIDFCHGNSVGKPIKNVEIKIADNNEIVVKTNSLFSGYTNREIPVEEWHRTGDTGYIDENGELYITGRTDNMIIVDSHNIYPEAVEQLIIENTEVKDCVVFKEHDKLVCSYEADNELGTDIIKTIRTKLLPYEVPRSFRRVNEIPMNKNGKKIRNNRQGEQR